MAKRIADQEAALEKQKEEAKAWEIRMAEERKLNEQKALEDARKKVEEERKAQQKALE